MAVGELTTALEESQDQGHVAGSASTGTLAFSLSPAFTDAGPDQIASLLPWLRVAAGNAGRGTTVLVGYPVTHGDTPAEEHEGFVLQPFLAPAPQGVTVVQTAAAWLNAYELVRAHGAQCVVLLATEVTSLDPDAVAAMVRSVCDGNADLALPRYDLPSSQGLLNAAVLSPLSRAIFNVDVRFPLALDFACSARMAERMAAAAQRFTATSQPDAVIWPVGEAAVAGYTFAEVPVGPRDIPQVADDLQAILQRIASSMFLDIETKATFWQRNRPASAVARSTAFVSEAHASGSTPPEEIAGLIESFRNGYNNLHELWSLVLPPNTLVTLKRLSVTPPESFALADATWVRIVYDFVLAHRLRTLTRNHLMGAFAPLYLAWVASHLAQADGATHVDQLAHAFESDKPYLVSRWRWPDRFNP